ncbi:nicotinate phosphoribosyltransferase [Spiribacter salinus M19-40]|jgi:nicotinate phosphoribosyltransferase|uniref:Nicotinate phosphoribosyltransferase n=2 Tax=Spiribacter salinus TaxID=1335746 RepID=R4VEK2_9GAMM|nr:nicotinate phosphoribosyltransferase [Spiribacter salinus]AGM40701.1 nicotinate phosphoribosyltransferase [Spiribacter salinus M19-40]
MNLERTPLLTDLYELTMLQTYYEHDMTGDAVFELFMRRTPRRGFFVAAGLQQALEWLEQLQFKPHELDWMRRCGFFSDAFVQRMADFRFTGHVSALPEGTVFFAEEPLVQIVAPLPEAQFIESRLMNILHYQTLIASKAARCQIAARDLPVIDFGMRRAHGGEAGTWAARACYIAGFSATATCLASARYDIPATGTMAHAFVLAHDSESEAFERFARSHPDNVVLLIDTYDVARGARRVVELAERLQPEGIQVQGVRIDSGDLVANARMTREILDAGGLTSTRILVSGGLDEYRIADLVAAGAPIDGVGVGSSVDTSADVPFLDSAYKLHQYEGKPRGKHAEGKTDLPGRKQIVRQVDPNGSLSRDILCLTDEAVEGTALLKPVMDGGKQLPGVDEGLSAARQRCADSLGQLPAALRALNEPGDHPVTLSEGLVALRETLIARTRTADHPDH